MDHSPFKDKTKVQLYDRATGKFVDIGECDGFDIISNELPQPWFNQFTGSISCECTCDMSDETRDKLLSLMKPPRVTQRDLDVMVNLVRRLGGRRGHYEMTIELYKLLSEATHRLHNCNPRRYFKPILGRKFTGFWVRLKGGQWIKK